MIDEDRIAADLACLAKEARRLGFNALTLDDVAHLAPHPWHGDALNARLPVLTHVLATIDTAGLTLADACVPW